MRESPATGKSMKRLVALGLVMVVICAGNAHAETVTLVADGWCPYNCEPNADKPGFMIEIAREAFGKHNITVEYSNLPWARAITEAREGNFTGIIGAYYGDAPDFIFPSVPQGVSQFSFYVNAGDQWNYNGIDSLAGRSLGVINDYSYSLDLDAYIEKNKADATLIQILSGDNAIDNNVKKLLAKRVDTIIEDRQAMSYYLSPDEYASIRTSIRQAGTLPSGDDDNGAIFIAFSPKSPNAKKYADILSAETIEMSKNGALKEILGRYGIEDFTAEYIK